MLDQQTDDRDRAITAARSTVTIARQRLDHVRRAFIDRLAGASDVVAAEAQLSRSLDELDDAAGIGWRA